MLKHKGNHLSQGRQSKRFDNNSSLKQHYYPLIAMDYKIPRLTPLVRSQACPQVLLVITLVGKKG